MKTSIINNYSLFFDNISNDSIILNIFGFSNPANEKMLSIIILYIEMMSILFAIALVVSFVVIFCIFFFDHKRNHVSFYFDKKVEALLDTFFALIPTVIISYLLIPALGFLFQIEYDENLLETLFNVHVIGHQWYWTYEIDTKIGSDLLICLYDSNFSFPILQFDSYMDRDSEINRLLNVDKSLVLPCGYNISFYITSHDVIHSWAVPQLGIKADALPGRLMKFILYASMEGIFYGQCSELCGVNHAFMPICVEIIKSKYFLDWLFLSLSCNTTQEITKTFKEDLIVIEKLDSDSNKNEFLSCPLPSKNKNVTILYCPDNTDPFNSDSKEYIDPSKIGTDERTPHMKFYRYNNPGVPLSLDDPIFKYDVMAEIHTYSLWYDEMDRNDINRTEQEVLTNFDGLNHGYLMRESLKTPGGRTPEYYLLKEEPKDDDSVSWVCLTIFAIHYCFCIYHI